MIDAPMHNCCSLRFLLFGEMTPQIKNHWRAQAYGV